MIYKELIQKIENGQIKLPIEVKITSRVWDDFELDRGCKAKLVKIEVESSDEVCLYFDFSDYVEYNKAYWEENWYIETGVQKVKYNESKWFKVKGPYSTVYVCEEEYIHFAIVEEVSDESSFEDKIKEYLTKNLQLKCKYGHDKSEVGIYLGDDCITTCSIHH